MNLLLGPILEFSLDYQGCYGHQPVCELTQCRLIAYQKKAKSIHIWLLHRSEKQENQKTKQKNKT